MMILAVFRSRAHSLDYAEQLQRHGIEAMTVSAPKEARIGCGLCVRLDGQSFGRAQAILKLKKYTSFKGFYKLDFVEGRMTLTPFSR